jgi:RNA polymerase sigma-70 factor, ECF subfamily
MDHAERGAPELIEAARQGDRAAQDALFERYRNYLALLARMSLPRDLQAKVSASDVVQDVFVRAHQGMGGFRGATEDELAAWLKQILANRLADARRRFVANEGRRVGRERSIEQMVEDSSQALRGFPAARGTSPSRGAERRETGALVADALARLKDDDREVIVLRSLEAREWSDVARRMDRHPEAVRALWGRAFQRLGTVVKEAGWGAP